MMSLGLLGERERAHLVVQPGEFSIYIFPMHSVYTYRIVLNVSTRFYFSVYATISLEPRASVLLSLSRSTPEHLAF